MNRNMLVGVAVVVLAVGACGGAFAADAEAATPSTVARSILSPVVPPQAKTGKAKTEARRRIAPLRLVQSAKGYIVGIRAADPVRKLPERIVLAVGGKTIEIALGPGTLVKGAKGRAIAVSRLRKGERVEVAYKPRGARAKADSITILS